MNNKSNFNHRNSNFNHQYSNKMLYQIAHNNPISKTIKIIFLMIAKLIIKVNIILQMNIQIIIVTFLMKIKV